MHKRLLGGRRFVLVLSCLLALVSACADGKSNPADSDAAVDASGPVGDGGTEPLATMPDDEFIPAEPVDPTGTVDRVVQEPDVTEVESSSEMVNENGGTVVISNLAFEIPAGALDSATMITITETDIPPLRVGEPLSPIFNCGPTGITFNEPVTVRFRIDGTPTEDIGVLWSGHDGGPAEKLTGVIDNGYYVVSITHCSFGALLNLAVNGYKLYEAINDLNTPKCYSPEGCCPEGNYACGTSPGCCPFGSTCQGTDSCVTCPSGMLLMGDGRCWPYACVGAEICGDKCCAQAGSWCSSGSCVACPNGGSRCGAGCCPSGTTCSDDEQYCLTVVANPCLTNNGGCDSRTTCSNSNGTASCSACPSGYSGSGASGCTDINECATNNGGCDSRVTCTNTPGGRACGACPSGYTGDGNTTCTAIVVPNPCATNNGGCDALTTCSNSNGTAACSACPNGYSGSGTSGCVDIDECATNNGGCDALTTCSNNPGGHGCGDCPSGYSGSGVMGCFDIDECATNNGGCGGMSTCSNNVGAPPTCTGMLAERRVFVTTQSFGTNLGGVAGADTRCQEAADAQVLGGRWRAWISDRNGNSPSQNLTPGAGPYRLLTGTVIANNWADLTDGTLAHGIDVYEDSTVAVGTQNVFTGTNTDGTALTSGGDLCLDWTVAGAGPSTRYGVNGVTDSTGAYWSFRGTHWCDQQYHLFCFEEPCGSGATACNFQNNCYPNNGGCDAMTTCTNTAQGRTCGACPSGYSGSGDGGCVDVNECATNNGGCDAITTCTNLLGSRSCGTCPNGYTGTGDTGCVDVDECATNNGGCDALTTCTNMPGGRTCGTCPSGYTGTGDTSCVDVNECATNNGGCDALTTCTNTPGARTCGTCPSGYSGTGQTSCVDIDECATNNGGCGAVQSWTCTNNIGAAPTCTMQLTGRRVFVTSATFATNFGGVVAGNTACQSAADAQSLGGNWRAWLSDRNGNSPAVNFTQSSGPYTLLNGTVIANNWADLTDGTLAHGIDVYENNTVAVGTQNVFTATNTDGTALTSGGDLCLDWTYAGASGAGRYGVNGVTDSTGAYWTFRGTHWCDQVFHLFCFEEP